MRDQLLELHVKEVFYLTKNTLYCEYGLSLAILQVYQAETNNLTACDKNMDQNITKLHNLGDSKYDK